MFKQKIISAEELSKYGPVSNLSEQAFALVKQQRETWQLARKNYEALSEVQTREFDFGHFKIVVQHNPGRIRSSAAKVDARSIAERPCFLCLKNLPEEQKAFVFQDKFLILVNPYPVFPVHLTIPYIKHKPQRILNFFPDMLDLVSELDGFTVFYNGPQCGASAPDHFHFQAGNRGYLPVENELEILEKRHSEILVQKPGLKIIAVRNYLRRFVSITSADRSQMLNAFQRLYTLLPGENGNEPMMNILCFFEKEEWRVIIFPREKLRPSHFYKEDKNQVVVSPAAVELGGVMVLPRQKDFDTVSNQIISAIYEEVTLSFSEFELLSKSVLNAYL
jgi:ATP adenylyltransferase/5',5'''-P-1,P-4-tetraphosphate phosphorylase II